MELTKASGRLIAIGGNEDKEKDLHILKKFVELAKGKNAHIVIMTVATEHPLQTGKEMTAVFESLGVKKVSVVDVSRRADTEDEKRLKLIEQATGLYFTGGDQIHITSLLGGSKLQKLIHKRYEKDLLIAGTSAGAAMMGNSMIIDGAGDEAPQLRSVEIGPGMDLIIGAMIDTHFSQRGRHGRLLAAVAHYPQDLGIGIDEDTAIIVREDEFEVIGSGVVTVIDGGAMTYTSAPDSERGDKLALADVRVHTLPEGYKFNLPERRFVIPPKKSKTAGAKNEES